MYKKLVNIYDHFEEIFLVLCIFVMVVVIFLQVVMRYGFNNSLSWTEELARFLFVWASWIGISFAQKKGEHIKITLINDKFKGKAKTIVLILGNLFTLAILAVLLYKGIEITGKVADMASVTSALKIPKWIIYASLPISCFLMSVRIIKGTINSVFIKASREAI